VLRDATLREGRDVPCVSFAPDERVAIATALAAAGVPEAEVVAPSRVAEDVGIARTMHEIPIQLTGLVYANRASWREDLELAVPALSRVDLLMPLSERREPHDPERKIEAVERALREACGASASTAIGAGFPHAFQVRQASVLDAVARAAAAGADRITLYDTNGAADPSTVEELVGRAVSAAGVPVFFHGHDDLGLATANAWAAVRAGAGGLDVTVNGLGDRAGNVSLEQLVVLLRLRGRDTGVDPAALPGLSQMVAELSGVEVPPLAPVVGRFAFAHRSPAHLPQPGEFEAFDPALIGTESRQA
jgi:homocitrate synthase NifV